MKAKLYEQQPLARICVNYDDPDTEVALKMLRDSGFRVISMSVSDLGEPTVSVEAHTYFGLEEIQRLISEARVEK